MIEATTMLVGMLLAGFSGAAFTDLLHRRRTRRTIYLHGTRWAQVGHTLTMSADGKRSLSLDLLPKEDLHR
jgi:hypothetical protein